MPFTPDIEPMLPREEVLARAGLADLALDLERKAARLAGQLSAATARVLERHMRVINSYYSNLIEGHRTHPWEIRQAMAGEYSEDPAKRDLQTESLAHIAVQEMLATEPPKDPTHSGCIVQIHRLFYERLPLGLCVVEGPQGARKRVLPGTIRQSGERVAVGRHVPPEPEALPLYLERFHEAYRLDHLRGHQRLIAVMAAHHRLAWIHPFLDGNGRVGRLHTDLLLRHIGLGAYGVWCVSRGLARQSTEYKAALARADWPRQGDGDGRGALSEGALIEWCRFMLEVAIDQVQYTTEALALEGFERRLRAYLEDRQRGLIPNLGPLRPEAGRLIEKAFVWGEFPRGEMANIAGLSHSVTRKLVQQLKEEGLLAETSSRSPLCFAIPEHAERYYLPNLAPPA